MSYQPLEDSLRSSRSAVIGVREKKYGKSHEVYEDAPCAWSAERGATHTLYCGEVDGPYGTPGRGTRPAKLLKSVMYVGVDEDEDGHIVWQKWAIRHLWRFELRQNIATTVKGGAA